jgi:hypothetical protein
MKNIGILDPDGIELNPLNGQPYSEQYKTLAKKWSKLQRTNMRVKLSN